MMERALERSYFFLERHTAFAYDALLARGNITHKSVVRSGERRTQDEAAACFKAAPRPNMAAAGNLLAIMCCVTPPLYPLQKNKNKAKDLRRV